MLKKKKKNLRNDPKMIANCFPLGLMDEFLRGGVWCAGRILRGKKTGCPVMASFLKIQKRFFFFFPYFVSPPVFPKRFFLALKVNFLFFFLNFGFGAPG